MNSQCLVVLLEYFLVNGNWVAYMEVIDVILCQVEQGLNPDVEQPGYFGDGALAGFLLDQSRLFLIVDLLALLVPQLCSIGYRILHSGDRDVVVVTVIEDERIGGCARRCRSVFPKKRFLEVKPARTSLLEEILDVLAAQSIRICRTVDPVLAACKLAKGRKVDFCTRNEPMCRSAILQSLQSRLRVCCQNSANTLGLGYLPWTAKKMGRRDP